MAGKIRKTGEFYKLEVKEWTSYGWWVRRG